MQETVNQEPTNETVNEQPKEERLFTQEEVNGFFNKRYSEMMSQLEEFKSKAEKYDALEEANKSELQKATEKAEKLQLELNNLKKADEVRSVREKVAKETGIPAASMSLLTGETAEECLEQAKTILAIAKAEANYPQIKDGGEVAHVISGKPEDQFKEWFNANFN